MHVADRASLCPCRDHTRLKAMSLLSVKAYKNTASLHTLLVTPAAGPEVQCQTLLCSPGSTPAAAAAATSPRLTPLRPLDHLCNPPHLYYHSPTLIPLYTNLKAAAPAAATAAAGGRARGVLPGSEASRLGGACSTTGQASPDGPPCAPPRRLPAGPASTNAHTHTDSTS